MAQEAPGGSESLIDWVLAQDSERASLLAEAETAEDAHRIFERFYRTDSSRTRTSGGTGLGLSIVDSLVRAHGGVVTVTTAPGHGCRFTVRLPRVGGAAGSAEGSDDLGLSLVE